jgi:NAD(P)-dependent dehydrogenase (short-subunit alcohol dehydrogenase family)
MKIQDAVALVTGANRGLGLAFTRALLAGGARKVYAGARDRSAIELPGVEPVALDVTATSTS